VRTFIPRLGERRTRGRPAVAIAIAGLAGCVLMSCSKYELVDVYSTAYPVPERIPLPKRALLLPPPEPGCTTETSGSGDDLHMSQLQRTSLASLAAASLDRSGPSTPATVVQSDSTLAQTDPNLGLSLRIRLEYERDCFRRAEMRTRERLLQLQRAVDATAKAVRRAEQSRP
jgi:hypothetical protein